MKLTAVALALALAGLGGCRKDKPVRAVDREYAAGAEVSADAATRSVESDYPVPSFIPAAVQHTDTPMTTPTERATSPTQLSQSPVPTLTPEPAAPVPVSTAVVSGPVGVWAVVTPPPDMGKAKASLEVEFGSLAAEREKLSRETVFRISSMLEHTSRLAQSSKYSREQREAIEAAIEAVDKSLNRAVSARDQESYDRAVSEARERLKDLASKLL